MKIRTSLQILLLLFGLTTCQKEKIANREYPRVKTLQVTEINESGAKFNAEIISGNLQDIEEYGFVWNSGDKVVSNEPIRNKNFSFTVHSALKKGTTYEVKAYVKTQNYQVFGPPITFISLGSEAPIITDFNKKSGTWGDTIKISGKNFRYKKEAIEVMVGEVYANVLLSTDTTILIQVPGYKNVASPYIAVSIEGNSCKSTVPFNFVAPQISSVNPLTFSFLDTIRINGNNFIKDTLINNVYFDGKKAKIISASSTLLKVVVPTTLISLQPKLSITGPTGDVEFSTPLNLKPVKLTSFQPDTIFTSDQIITIKGENFNPVSANNKITIKGIDAPIVSASETELKIRIPSSLVPGNDISIITNGEMSVTSSQQNAKFDKKLEIYFKRKWTRWKDFPGGIRVGGIGFSIGDKGYVGMGYSGNSAGPYYNDLWEYDPQTDQWTQKADFPGSARLFQSSFTLANEGYVGLGSTTSDFNQESFLKDFYKYNPGSDSWSKLPDYPGKARARAACFLKNGKAYVGTGRSKYDGSENVYNDDFWSWDPTSGQWNASLNYPSKTQELYGFTIGNSGLLFNGSFWEFTGNSWINRYNTYTSYSGDKATFTIGNMGYILYYEGFLTFNNSTGLVNTTYLSQQVLFYPYLPSIFVINNRAYMVCGGRNAMSQSVWEFDPSK